MTRRPKTVGKLLIAIFLLWQVFAVLHLVLAVHTFCPEHHAVAHVDRKGQLEHHRDVPFASDDECFVLVALAANGAVPEVDVPSVLALDFPVFEIVDADLHGVVLLQRYRFRLSPSQSPPIGSV